MRFEVKVGRREGDADEADASNDAKGGTDPTEEFAPSRSGKESGKGEKKQTQASVNAVINRIAETGLGCLARVQVKPNSLK
ncbi:MAG: hypothetical protein JSV36_11185 [Anaerolineae bacterium]|nr:MAG: hypothetical protein JSV36_11185 [Anaerolineae bacterium]